MKTWQPRIFLIVFLSVALLHCFVKSSYAPSDPYVSGVNCRFLFESSSTLCFQHNINETVELRITTGLLNSSTNLLNMDAGGGYFRFTAVNNAQIKINYSVTSLKVSGDQNHSLRDIPSGHIITVQSGNDVLITWVITFEPLWPFLFVFGMVGLVGMFAGPYYAISNFKKNRYLHGARTGLIVTVIGVALFIAWLW